VNDGVIRRIGRSAALGRYVVLEDVYGNQYTYAQLGRVPAVYPVPKDAPEAGVQSAPRPTDAPPPQAPASAGTQVAPEKPQASMARGPRGPRGWARESRRRRWRAATSPRRGACSRIRPVATRAGPAGSSSSSPS